MVAERGLRDFPQALPKFFFHQSIEGLNLGSEALVEVCFVAWPHLLLDIPI